MEIILENYDYENSVIINDRGTAIIRPGETLYLLMKSRPASLSVVSTGTFYYMVSATQANSEKIKEGLATFLDADSVDFSVSEDFIIETAGGIKIENSSGSMSDLEVDWRI